MFKRWLFIFSAFLVLMSSIAVCKKGTEEFDILVKHGRVFDGTGNPWFYGDIGIRGDTIVDIGDLGGMTAAKTIDAKGFDISPGFIDMHTHCDVGLGETTSNANLNYLSQGVTTVVTGNCGGSVSLNAAETKKEWEEQGIGTNAVILAGHGNIRRAVMGVEPRESTPDEVAKMKQILLQAMENGAWGMSTGLQYVPGRFATTEEIIELTKVVGEFGGIYTSHQRSEEKEMVEATAETIRIGLESGVRVNSAHIKAGGKSNWGKMKEAGRLINEARSQGIYITADMYPYEYAGVGSIAGWFNIPDDLEPLTELEKKMRDRDLDDKERETLRAQHVDELAKALQDPAKRAQIKKLTAEGSPHKSNFAVLYGWDSCSVVFAEKNTHLIGKIVSDIADEQKKDPFDVAADLFIEEKQNVLSSVDTMSEDDMKYAMSQDWQMFSSDGSAALIKNDGDKPVPGHPRDFGSFSRVIRKYVKEDRELTLGEAVRKMTSLPASFLQMKDRGLLLKGLKADIVMFNSDTVMDNATYADSEKYASGIEYVIVNGKISIENGEYNGNLHGKVLLLTEQNP
jgi:N-acyl-D-aspartate/D-glutamate deacylase